MLSKKMQDALNDQITAELYSSYMYLSMAAHFESANLKGFANWMHVQAHEEYMHAMKFYHHILERRGKVTLAGVDAPPNKWASPLAAFEGVFAHEQKVTGLIDKLVKLAAAEEDAATGIFLQWFVTEQIEEEASADHIVFQLRAIKDSPQGLFMLDSVLGVRKAGHP